MCHQPVTSHTQPMMETGLVLQRWARLSRHFRPLLHLRPTDWEGFFCKSISFSGMHSRLFAGTLADMSVEYTARRGLTCADVVCQLSCAVRHRLSQVDHEAHSLHQRREEQLRLGIELVLRTPAAERAPLGAMCASSSCTVSWVSGYPGRGLMSMASYIR